MITLATLDDIPLLKELCIEYKPNFNELYNIEDLLKSKFHKIFIYKENLSIVGFIILEETFETLSILHLYVQKNYRRKKIATMLIEHTILTAKEYMNIILEVRTDNLAAVNLYKKYNFKIINIRKKYYNGIDAYVMERKINLEECKNIGN